MAYSIQRAVSDGTLKRVVISIKYFDKTDLTVYVNDAYAPVGVLWDWDGNDVLFKANVQNGYEVKIVRKTKFNEPYHIFDKGAMFKDSTIDDNFNQMLFLAQETSEGATATDFYQDLNFHGYRLTKVGQAVDDYDAVPLSQYKADANGAYQSRLAAETARTAAVNAQNAAAASASAAGTSASSAGTSASAASASASSAAASASTSTAAASAASASKDSATAAATLASDWAAKVSGPVSGGEYSAKYWAQQSLAGTIPDNSITTGKIVDNAVTAAKIPDGAITRVKLSTTIQTELNGYGTDIEALKTKTAQSELNTQAVTAKVDDLYARVTQRSGIRVHTANGNGSAKTTYRRFLTVISNTGSDIVYTDSATDGSKFTIKSDGIYTISYSDGGVNPCTIAISLNDTQPTLGISDSAIIPANILANSVSNAGWTTNCSWTGPLSVNDVIIPRSDIASSSSAKAQFAIYRIL